MTLQEYHKQAESPPQKAFNTMRKMARIFYVHEHKLQVAMSMPPLALRQLSHVVDQHDDLTTFCKKKLLAACLSILHASQAAFFSERCFFSL